MKLSRQLFPFAVVSASLALGSFSANAAEGAASPAAAKPYPLSTCVVSGEKLGTMGKPFVHSVEGREVQFCCKACLKEFNKDTQKFLKKLDAASKPKA
jgi:YHS domain-containing protein